MKLSTRSRYGLLALYELANNDTSPTTIRAIAERQNLSEAYLEQLFSVLKKENILISKRGAQGGYLLARDAADISIHEIISALEGSTLVADCVMGTDCGSTCNCPSRPIYMAIQQSIDETMSNMSLKDMLENNTLY